MVKAPAVEAIDTAEPAREGPANLPYSAPDREGITDRRLHVVAPGTPTIDLPRAAAAVRELLGALNVDPSAPGLVGTPDRVARAYAELLTPESFDATTFPNDEGYDELVIEKDIPFSSLCEHHLLPFSGVAHVGYLPGERLLGLSKLARVVSFFSRRLQVQERLTTQVADWLSETLQPRGVGVVLEAEHSCLSTRGARMNGARTVTSALRGLIREDERTRTEFFMLAGGRR
jgi:GTP cyclohydrolase I